MIKTITTINLEPGKGELHLMIPSEIVDCMGTDAILICDDSVPVVILVPANYNTTITKSDQFFL